MKEIVLLNDYKDQFGSKQKSESYRSGMDKGKLYDLFLKKGFKIKYMSFCDAASEVKCLRNQYVLYTSSEDKGGLYKSYIEDIVFALETYGAQVIPKYKYLRAHENKVFMELLRLCENSVELSSITSHHFGTFDEFLNKKDIFNYPSVIKKSFGAMSRGVFKANNLNKLKRYVKKLSRSRSLLNELWDLGRSIKHRGYKRESKYRKKFIVQQFIPNLKNDWKILIFGNKYFILHIW